MVVEYCVIAMKKQCTCSNSSEGDGEAGEGDKECDGGDNDCGGGKAFWARTNLTQVVVRQNLNDRK